MVRVGVLSASYKFKVLALDARGLQFLVMIDLARDFAGDTAALAEIEALIAQTAKARHGLRVSAVYWRASEHVALGRPDVSAARAAQGAQAAPLAAQPAGAPGADPLHEDEVAAFRRALAAAQQMPAAPAPRPAALSAAAAAAAAGSAAAHAAQPSHPPGPRSYTLLTGYEDTEVNDPDFQNDALGGTQYGSLN